MSQEYTDRLALEVALQVHRSAGAKQTFLFGSRARGDHRPDSDIDVLVITAAAQPDGWLERLRQQAREIQKTSLPEAAGIDIVHMPEDEFLGKIHLRNNMANTIIKEGFPVMSNERLGYRNEFSDEEVDWNDVEQKLKDADGAARWIEGIERAGIIDLGDDKQFGRMAQNALEFAYKATLAAFNCEYPKTGRDGHNLIIITGLLRKNNIIADHEEVPGERHRYLTEFGGAAVYAHEHPPLDRRRIAEDVPQAVQQLKDLVDQARG